MLISMFCFSLGNRPIDAMLKWAFQIDQKMIDVVMPPLALSSVAKWVNKVGCRLTKF